MKHIIKPISLLGALLISASISVGRSRGCYSSGDFTSPAMWKTAWDITSANSRSLIEHLKGQP